MCNINEEYAVYEGEMGRNAYSKGMEHMDGLIRRDTENPLWKLSRTDRIFRFKRTVQTKPPHKETMVFYTMVFSLLYELYVNIKREFL